MIGLLWTNDGSMYKKSIFHGHNRAIADNDIPLLMVNNTRTEQVTVFNSLGLRVNEYMNWNLHKKLLNKIWRILAVINRLKRSVPISAMEFIFDSLILPHLQYEFVNWGFEWELFFS